VLQQYREDECDTLSDDLPDALRPQEDSSDSEADDSQELREDGESLAHTIPWVPPPHTDNGGKIVIADRLIVSCTFSSDSFHSIAQS
jgi:hypothetical protein